jgi:hypothetical protein
MIMIDGANIHASADRGLLSFILLLFFAKLRFLFKFHFFLLPLLLPPVDHLGFPPGSDISTGQPSKLLSSVLRRSWRVTLSYL